MPATEKGGVEVFLLDERGYEATMANMDLHLVIYVLLAVAGVCLIAALVASFSGKGKGRGKHSELDENDAPLDVVGGEEHSVAEEAALVEPAPREAALPVEVVPEVAAPSYSFTQSPDQVAEPRVQTGVDAPVAKWTPVPKAQSGGHKKDPRASRRRKKESQVVEDNRDVHVIPQVESHSETLESTQPIAIVAPTAAAAAAVALAQPPLLEQPPKASDIVPIPQVEVPTSSTPKIKPQVSDAQAQPLLQPPSVEAHETEEVSLSVTELETPEAREPQSEATTERELSAVEQVLAQPPTHEVTPPIEPVEDEEYEEIDFDESSIERTLRALSQSPEELLAQPPGEPVVPGTEIGTSEHEPTMVVEDAPQPSHVITQPDLDPLLQPEDSKADDSEGGAAALAVVAVAASGKSAQESREEVREAARHSREEAREAKEAEKAAIAAAKADARAADAAEKAAKATQREIEVSAARKAAEAKAIGGTREDKREASRLAKEQQKAQKEAVRAQRAKDRAAMAQKQAEGAGARRDRAERNKAATNADAVERALTAQAMSAAVAEATRGGYRVPGEASEGVSLTEVLAQTGLVDEKPTSRDSVNNSTEGTKVKSETRRMDVDFDVEHQNSAFAFQKYDLPEDLPPRMSQSS